MNKRYQELLRLHKEKTEREAKEKARREALDSYVIKQTFKKGEGGHTYSARGYKEMRQKRREIWIASTKYKGWRAYTIQTVNETKGKIVR